MKPSIPEPKDYYKEPEKTSPKIRKLEEKVKALKYKEKVNDSDFLKKNNIKAVGRKGYFFWKLFATICFLTLIVLICLFIFTDKLDKLSPNFNNNLTLYNQVDNSYDFNPTTNNQYDHQVYINTTNHIYVNNFIENSS